MKSIKSIYITITTVLFARILYYINKSINNSSDFQWSATNLILNGINPYDSWLAQNSNNLFLATQDPVYIPSLYLLFMPYGFLPLKVAVFFNAIFNVIFMIFIVHFLGTIFELNTKLRFLLFSIFCVSFPARTSIDLGQTSLLCLFLFILGIYYLEKKEDKLDFLGYFIFGIGFFKYTFAPSFFVGILNLYKKKKFILLSFLFPLMGYFYCSLMTNSNIFKDLFKPLLIAKEVTTLNMIGQGDLMSLFDILSNNTNSYLIGVIALLLSIFIPLLAFKYNLKGISYWSVITISSLCFFRHLYYDYIFLIIPLIYSILEKNKFVKCFLFSSIIWFWFLSAPVRVILTKLTLIDTFTPILIFFGFILNITSLILIFKNEKNLIY